MLDNVFLGWKIFLGIKINTGYVAGLDIAKCNPILLESGARPSCRRLRLTDNGGLDTFWCYWCRRSFSSITVKNRELTLPLATRTAMLSMRTQTANSRYWAEMRLQIIAGCVCLQSPDRQKRSTLNSQESSHSAPKGSRLHSLIRL